MNYQRTNKTIFFKKKKSTQPTENLPAPVTHHFWSRVLNANVSLGEQYILPLADIFIFVNCSCFWQSPRNRALRIQRGEERAELGLLLPKGTFQEPGSGGIGECCKALPARIAHSKCNFIQNVTPNLLYFLFLRLETYYFLSLRIKNLYLSLYLIVSLKQKLNLAFVKCYFRNREIFN